MMSNNTQPLVSIAVPVYNGDKYLDECLKSILEQTYDNWECVINNNCSKDRTAEIAQKFVDIDKRFKLFNNEDFVPLAKNWSIAHSKCDKNYSYFKILGADDWLFPEYVEKMVLLMESNKSIGVCSSYRLNDTRVDMDGLDIKNGGVIDGQKMLYDQLTRRHDISGSATTLLFSVEHLKRLPYYPDVIHEDSYHIDTELMYDVLSLSDAGFVFQVLSYTRRHPEAGTSTQVFRFGTLFQLNDKVLYKFKGDDKILNKLYIKNRYKYAYLYLKSKFIDKKTYNWHKKFLRKGFGFSEYFLAILIHNPLSCIVGKIFLKLKNTFSSN